MLPFSEAGKTTKKLLAFIRGVKSCFSEGGKAPHQTSEVVLSSHIMFSYLAQQSTGLGRGS